MLNPNITPMRARSFTLFISTFILAAIATAQVPVLLKDINPNGASNPGGFTCISGVVYFSANDGVHGTELWKTDGTEAGTVMVKDIEPGSGSSFPTTFMDVDGAIYFTTNDVANGVRLWTTDGTESGTQLALTLADVPGLLEWIYFVPLGDRIFFRGHATDTGRELWSTDGTAAGTTLFMDIHPGPNNSGFQNPMSHAGKIYFTASDGTNGSEPWMSDGTLAGTQMIAETIPGPGSSGTTPTSYTAVGNLVFFRAGTSATGDELWATDGTISGTGVVRDIYIGTNSSLPAYLTAHNGLLYMRAYNIVSNYIWQSDGTQAGTMALPLPTPAYTSAENLCSHNGLLYFSGYNGSSRQLWRTDGSASGSQEVLYPGSDALNPLSNSGPMLSCNGDLFFRANYMSTIGQEPYVLSLTTDLHEAARIAAYIYPNPTSQYLQFTGFPTTAVVELYATDGRMLRTARTHIPLDVADMPAGMYAARLRTQEGRLLHQQLVVIER